MHPCAPRLRPRGALVVLLLALALPVGARAAVAENAGASAPAYEDYVGKVANSRFFIAVSIEKDGIGERRVEVYACDGRGGWHRLLGRAEGPAIALEKGDVSVAAVVSGNVVRGTFSTDQRTFLIPAAEGGFRPRRFTARLAKTVGGLYTSGQLRGARKMKSLPAMMSMVIDPLVNF